MSLGPSRPEEASSKRQELRRTAHAVASAKAPLRRNTSRMPFQLQGNTYVMSTMVCRMVANLSVPGSAGYAGDEWQSLAKTLMGKTITINENVNDNIYRLREKAYIKDGTSPEHDLFMLSGKVLQDYHSTEDAGAHKGCVMMHDAEEGR